MSELPDEHSAQDDETPAEAPRERIDHTDPFMSFDPEVDPDYPDATARRGRGRDDRK